MSNRRLLTLARSIDPLEAAGLEARFADVLPPGSMAFAIAIALGAAYPALRPVLLASPGVATWLALEGHQTARERVGLWTRLTSAVGDLRDSARVRAVLRRVARDERIRIALRELLPASLGGADLDVTARELSVLADATIGVALAEALLATSARVGEPITEAGVPARFAVLGMGKLGGEELNAGSDVDLLFLYDTDDGAAVAPDGTRTSLHDTFTRVARRLTATLDDVTEDGFVWRVDLRLRPEGRSGPIVNSLAAAERYYESFGRLWERAALVRARAVAGDEVFGAHALEVLEPFIWRKHVDPAIAAEMVQLAHRSRAELSRDPELDLKHGIGGIREAEFFVQSLQLIWGGREPRIRAKGTLDALRRLRALGLVSDREWREVAAGYLALRRAEHAIQNGTGQQTHARPADGPDLDRLARALGFTSATAFVTDLTRHRTRIAARFVSLVPGRTAGAGLAPPSRWAEAIAGLERQDPDSFRDALVRVASAAPTSPFDGPDAAERWAEVARDLGELGRHPDGLLGARSRESFPGLADTVLDATVDAADPSLAARTLRALSSRLRQPGIYAKLLGADRHAVRRLVDALGASAFVGEAVSYNPEIAEFVLFARGAPTPEVAAAEVASSVRAVAEPEDEALAGALRRAKARVTIEVALADLAGELGTREATLTLSALADATLEAALRAALGTPEGEPIHGFCVLAMGKLGGRAIGYGSDLDVLFLYDTQGDVDDRSAFYARVARRVIRLISASHEAGPGYDLDTRLRPSGNQGLLVTSIDAFARYHGVAHPTADEPGSVPRVRAAAWERLALLRARPAAGDRYLGARALSVAHAAAYDLPFDEAELGAEVHRLRLRMERELSQERPGRYDIKLGRGGLADVELAVQLVQLKNGRDRRVRTPETSVAIEALAAAGYLRREHAEALREGYAFLRKLEQRLRIVHASAAQLLEESAPGLAPLARRLGIRDRRGNEAASELVARYAEVTGRVRTTFESLVGTAE